MRRRRRACRRGIWSSWGCGRRSAIDVRGRSYGDVNRVEDEEADRFPQLDALVEEDEDQVGDAEGVEENVAQEGVLVDLAVGEDGDASGDDGGDEQTGTHIGAHTNLRHSRKHGDDQREHVGSSVAKGQEGDACD